MEDKKSITIENHSESAPLDMNSTVSAQLHAMSPADWREQAVSEYLNCVLCGKEFKFVQITDFACLIVDEESHCEHCNIRGTRSTYTLQ